MKDYFQNDIKIQLNLEDEIETFGEHFKDKITNKEFETKLLYNQRKPEYLTLTIFYEQSDFLYEKLNFLHEKGVNILNVIKPKTFEYKWQIPDYFDFSNSNLIEIKESHYWEHDKKPVILVINCLDIISNNCYAGDGRFKLTENIFLHLESYINYGQLANYETDDKFIDENKNRFTKFGPVNFILFFQHFYKQSKLINDIIITRDAFLKINDETKELTDRDIINIGNDLCILMSLYWEKTISFFIATIRINDIENYRSREILKFSDNNYDETKEYHLNDLFRTFYDFIETISFDKYIECKEILEDSISRLLRTKNVDNISAFMILYNIIENLRNYMQSNTIDNNILSIKEEYCFIYGKDKTNLFIKNKIKDITEIVQYSDKNEFIKKANEKVSFIKKTGLKDQLDSLISHMNLKPENYDINFTDLIRIRNSIYHGKMPLEDIKPYNKQLKVLIYDILLKMISY